WQYLKKVSYSLFKLGIDVPPQAADPKRVSRESRADEVFKNLEDLFALAKTIKQNRDGSDIDRVRAKPQQMRSYSLEFRQNHSKLLGALWHFDLKQPFDSLDVTEVSRNRGDVVEAIPVRRDHRVGVVFGDLLNASMQIADVAIQIHDGLAVQLQYDPQD